MILVVFALLASAVVLYYGLQDLERNKFKLVLHCIMIVTSVVPPELPMELSLAITTSLTALSKCLVYCTEPHRLPYAGKLDILCFDKTGTLTKDKMELKGVLFQKQFVGQTFSENLDILSTTDHRTDSNTKEYIIDKELSTVASAPSLVITTMAACHSLVLKNSQNIYSYIGKLFQP
jgi:cation-transporting ATPase 13A1